MARSDSHAAAAAARDGAAHLGRYRELDAAGLDGTAEVEAAVAAFRRAVAAGPDPATAPAYAYNLALALQSRYDAVGEPAGDDTDFRAAIDLLERAVAATEGAASPYEPVLRYGLGAALRRRAQEDGDLATLRRAVGLLGDALATGQDGSLDGADCLYEYGRALLALADADTDPDEGADLVDEAVRALEEVAGGVDPAAPDRAAYLDAAGSARLLRYDRLGRDEDLAAALAAARAAVDLQRAAGRPTAAALANLAGALVTRGIRAAVAGPDLAEAEALDREALGIAAAQADGSAAGQVRDRLAGIRTNLAGVLLARSERSGDLGPLDEAVELAEDAVRESTPGSIPLALRAHQLAVARRSRYLRTGDTTDLDAAAAAHRQALAVPVPPVERSTLLDSWANTLRTRFDRSADVADLTAAIAAYDEALAVPGGAAADRGARQNNLGGALAALAEASGDVGAADRARAVLTEAVASTAADSLEHARALVNLGNVLADRYARLGEAGDRTAAEDAFAQVRRSWDLRAGSTESALQAALNAGDWALERADWADAVDWLERALEAVEELVVVQHRRLDKESWLRDARDASLRAAAAALRCGDPERAVTLLERGRALLASEAMEQARLDLDALDAAGAHELRLRLEAAGQDRAWSERPVLAGRSLAGHPAVDLRQLRDEIRAVPGFESFLAAPEFADVAAAATTPLVYLAAAADRGTALVVRGRSVRSLPLPRLTDAAVRGQAGALLTAQETYLAAIGAGKPDPRTPWTQTLQEIGAWLWTAAGDALSAELAGAAATVVAGGLLGLLPLHAAGRPDPAAPSGWHYLMDDVQLSYVPNARVLSAAETRASAAGTGRLLAVAQPRPSALAPLPYTGTEAIVAAAAFGGDAPPVLLAGPDATASAVVAALPGCDVAHFGCHGQADLSVPLASALLLRDDAPLSLGELLPLRLDLRLAVLSACETGQPGTALPDEVISLPAGLLQTGAAGVVATGWVVPDGPSAALITEFYRRWRSEDQPPGRALAGAQAWLRDTTNGEKARGWLRAVADGAAWLPAAAADALLDLYLPREPDALDDAGIDVWAGFAHYGC